MPQRDNGLHAQTYAALADLESQLADTLLERLRSLDIAAYAVPLGTDQNYLAAQLPRHRTDRLYVNAAATEHAWQALQTLQTHFPSMDAEREALGGEPAARESRAGQEAAASDNADTSRDEEAIWREIVEGYDKEPSGTVPPWPASEDLNEDEYEGRAGSAEATGRYGRQDERDREGKQHRDAQPASDPEEHFIPPSPPPVPRPAPVAAAAWLGLFGGPAYLLLATMLNWHIPGWAALVSAALFVGGFVTLVVRMGDEPPPPDSGPDNGAVV